MIKGRPITYIFMFLPELHLNFGVSKQVPMSSHKFFFFDTPYSEDISLEEGNFIKVIIFCYVLDLYLNVMFN